MQEKDPDTGERKIDQEIIFADDDAAHEAYEEQEEDEEKEIEKEPEVLDIINEELSQEERQTEFINLMKERFVDGKDPEYDYNEIENIFNKNEDEDLTDEWFDQEEEAEITKSDTNQKSSEDEIEDYMTMDFS